MGVYAPIKLKYNLVSTYPGTAQRNWVGAQGLPNQRGWFNNFADPTGTVIAQFIDAARYLYYTACDGTVTWLKRWDILQGTSTILGTVNNASRSASMAIFVDQGYVYVGGTFSSVTPTGGSPTTRNNLLRFSKNNLVLDPSWNPNVNSQVTSIVGNVSGNGGPVYAGGLFTTVNGSTSRNRLAAFDSNGNVTAWNPALTGNAVTSMIYLTAGTTGVPSIVFGGIFTAVQATTRNNVAELTTAGAGTLTAWNPNANSTVRCLAVDTKNQVIYMGGNFTTIGGVTRNYAASLGYAGNLTTWNPAPYPSVPFSIAVKANEPYPIAGAYIGGTTSGGAPFLLKYDLQAGAALPFFPPLTGGTNVNSLVLFERTVYAGGSYTAVGPCYPISSAAGGFGAYLNAFPDPLFIDQGSSPFNAVFVSQTNPGNVGTYGLPFATITQAYNALTGAATGASYVVILDSATYNEKIVWSFADGGLYAIDGQAPTIQPLVGALNGTFGARVSGRTLMPSLISPFYLSKAGNDSTGTQGNAALPYLTIGGAITAMAGSGGTILIQDSGTYIEDINCGANNVAIAAAFGQVPTLINVSTSTQHIKANSTQAVALYGLNIQEKKTGTNAVFKGNFQLAVYDCTVSGKIGGVGVYPAGAGVNRSFRNCLFQGLTVIEMGYDIAEFTNCMFIGCQYPITYGSNSGNSLVTNCTFQGSILGAIYNGVQTSVGTLTVTNCLFNGCSRDNIAAYTNGYVNSGLSLASYGGFAILSVLGSTCTWTINNCYFTNCDRGAAMISASNVTIENSVGYRNGVNLGAQGNNFYLPYWVAPSTNASIYPIADFTFCPDGSHNNSLTGLSVANCASIGHPVYGIGAFATGDNSGTSTATAITMSVAACTVINAGVGGFFFSTGVYGTGAGATNYQNISYSSPTVTVQNNSWNSSNLSLNPLTISASGLVEYGSPFSAQLNNLYVSNPGAGSNLEYGGSVTYTGSVIPNPSTGYFVPDGTDIIANPLIVSNAVGAEDISLFPASPAIGFGNATGSVNCGYDNPIFTIAADGVAVDGVTFLGLTNVFSGIWEAAALPNGSVVKYCSFSDDTFIQNVLQSNCISFYGVYKNSPGQVSYCFFANDGIGVVSLGQTTIKNNVFDECSGGGIGNIGYGATINNNSSYACPYGQYDVGAAISQVNNVYSDSTVYDYFGFSLQSYACIGTLSPAAGLDAESIQLNPLYINPLTQNQTVSGTPGSDLRVQALAGGENFNSPVLNAGSDGYDMGAFRYDYGALVALGTEIVLDVPYRNPDKVEYLEDAIKLAEGINEDGSTYSDATTFKTHWRFTWNQNSNDMPLAQTQALLAAYKTPLGQVDLDMGDGNGYQPGTILREVAFEYTDVTGLYSSTGVPLVVKQLDIRMT